MKKLFIVVVFVANIFTSAIASSTFFTCPHAVPTSDPNFCASFKSVAYCHCTEHNMPPSACSDMHRIYQVMLAMYGSLPNACSPAAQKDTSQQECIDDWTFYNTKCH